MFYMWRADRDMQWACFRNAEIAPKFNIDGHGRHSVTPEQVRIQTGFKNYIDFLRS